VFAEVDLSKIDAKKMELTYDNNYVFDFDTELFDNISLHLKRDLNTSTTTMTH